MNIPLLVIKLQGKRIGVLFEFMFDNTQPIIRFAVDEDYAREPFGTLPTLSESFRAGDPAQQQSFWLNRVDPAFNAITGNKGDLQLPTFFQNLLPEGAFRRHVAEEAIIAPDDNFRLLAACGKDLSGAVTAEWEDIGRDALQDLITQGQDALEVTVWAEPFQDAISISGVQPKLGVNKDATGRFVGRTKHHDTSIIAKLPSAEYPRMPQMEDLSMRLACLAGVNTCGFELAEMAALGAGHRYDLGEEATGYFLAVSRFDRGAGGRVHFEDFAQVLGIAPERKYSSSYAQIALTLLALPKCGVPAVHELLRRIEVNELLGNADMHLKNLGLIYRDQRDAELAPAYDILSTHVYLGTHGHALALLEEREKAARDPREPLLDPRSLLKFCNALEIEVKLATQVVRDTAKAAVGAWLEPILAADITPTQRHTLLRRLLGHPHFHSAFRRSEEHLQQRWNEAVQMAD